MSWMPMVNGTDKTNRVCSSTETTRVSPEQAGKNGRYITTVAMATELVSKVELILATSEPKMEHSSYPEASPDNLSGLNPNQGNH